MIQLWLRQRGLKNTKITGGWANKNKKIYQIVFSDYEALLYNQQKIDDMDFKKTKTSLFNYRITEEDLAAILLIFLDKE